MHAFVVITEKYVRPYGYSGTNFTAGVNCLNPKTEIQNEIIKIICNETCNYFNLTLIFFGTITISMSSKKKCNKYIN